MAALTGRVARWPGPALFTNMDDLFSGHLEQAAPLAVRMRPVGLSDVAGQTHLTGPGMPLARLLAEAGQPGRQPSVILWGPPGTGKTTLAMLAARVGGRRFEQLSAVTAGVKEVRDVIDTARDQLALQQRGTVLFVDEVHRFSKAQQDALLPAVENGWVTLVAATTENPSFSVIAPLLSRSLVLTLKPLEDHDIAVVVQRAIDSEVGLNRDYTVDDEALEQIITYAAGDARRALTALEAAAAVANESQVNVITGDHVAAGASHKGVRYDKDGDQHYDVISGFIKSLRGSDADAALHYLARMIVAGEDPRFIARRLIVHASEDVGMADPTALRVAVAAANTVQLIGMPEARIALAQATIHIALAPKSNAVIVAIDSAIADVQNGRIGEVPAHLRDAHYPGAKALGHGVGYRYPHDFPGSVVAQEYLPEVLVDKVYYQPGENGIEARYAEAHERARRIVRGHPND